MVSYVAAAGCMHWHLSDLQRLLIPHLTHGRASCSKVGDGTEAESMAVVHKPIFSV
jgi:hypothetical protein